MPRMYGDGKVTIELYDDAPIEGGPPKLLETTIVSADLLKGMISTDQIGQGYTLIVPGRADLRVVHFKVKYEPKNGTPLYAMSSSVPLEHGVHAVSAIQPAGAKPGQ